MAKKIHKSNPEDRQLIEKYLAGDEKALELLIQKYLKPIYGFAYSKVGSQADAEDIAQEVFLKVWKNIKKFRLDKDFKPWIFQIAKNTCIDHLRKKKAVPFSKFENEAGQNALLDNISANPLDLLESLNNRQVLAMATQNLSMQDKVILGLRHNDGLTFREIAEIFEESINTIKSRYRRTLADIRETIKI